jgi:hypothetical protein
MVYAEISTVIERDASWARGVRLIGREGPFNIDDWTLTAKILSAAGSVLQTIVGEITEDVAVFCLSHTQTGTMSAQAGRWEIWALRSDDFKICLVKGRASIV